MIVLIHGSTQNSACWDLLRPHLPETMIVELPPDRPEATATDFARMAADQMRGVADDCIVVGHSASGAFLPRIAHLRPVGALVYLAAAIPEVGKSAMQQLQENPDMLHPDWLRAGREWSEPSRWRDLADRFLFHDVPNPIREWAQTTIRPMRVDAAFREPLALLPAVKSLCVVATLDRTINPAWQERTWDARGRLERIEAGHCPHFSRPRETAEMILGI